MPCHIFQICPSLINEAYVSVWNHLELCQSVLNISPRLTSFIHDVFWFKFTDIGDYSLQHSISYFQYGSFRPSHPGLIREFRLKAVPIILWIFAYLDYVISPPKIRQFVLGMEPERSCASSCLTYVDLLNMCWGNCFQIWRWF